MTIRADDAGGEPLRFVLDGEPVTLDGVDPTRTLLQYLREDCHRTGTKEGCAEGDCGACTVVVLAPDPGAAAGVGRLRVQAVNACIQFLPTLHGKAVLTAAGLCAADEPLHPVQRAMVECHASQCGFCTPGFVMSLFALYKTARPADRAAVDDALAGNLCRCTGYRPIVAAAFRMLALGDAQAATPRTPPWTPQEAWYRTPAASDGAPATGAAARFEADLLARLQDLTTADPHVLMGDARRFVAPRTVAALVQVLADTPDACLLAGGTDVGLWVTKGQRRLDPVVYIGEIGELATIEAVPGGGLRIGAAVRLSDAVAPLLRHSPELRELLARFASPPIRNAATLVGNIANGSPIGDSMPALLALDAVLSLRSAAGVRTLALAEFYLDYQVTALRAGEFIESVCLPPRAPGRALRCYKISKRIDQDICALTAAFSATRLAGTFHDVRIAFGGMAAVPLRVPACEAALEGRAWAAASVADGVAALDAALSPIDDLRASAAYRRRVAGNLLHKFALETHAATPLRRIGVYDREPQP